MLSRELPKHAHKLVKDWIGEKTAALQANWTRMEKGEQMEYIEGLE